MYDCARASTFTLLVATYIGIPGKFSCQLVAPMSLVEQVEAEGEVTVFHVILLQWQHKMLRVTARAQ